MSLDQLSMQLVLASPVLGLLAVIIVGSQAPEDARPVAVGTLWILGPLLLLSGTCLGVSPRWDHYQGVAGMVVMFSVMILSVRLGYRIARGSGIARRDGARSKGGGPGECES